MTSAQQKSIFFHAVAFVVVALFFGCIWYSYGDYRFSDPDQYYHFALSRHLASTWDFFSFPGVKGMGWESHFVDKEFLFHVFTSLGYGLFGDSGVLAVVFVCSCTILWLLYRITYELTQTVSLAFFAALSPLLSDTFVVRLLVVRAYLLAVVFLLLMVLFLVRRDKRGVFLTSLFFALSYHAFLVPTLFLLLWFATHQRSRLPLWGFTGLLCGILLNPYFPQNIFMSALGVQVAIDQFQPTGLNFGPEQIPYRSDNFLLVFKYVIFFLFLGLSVLWLRFQNSRWLKSTANDSDFIFFSSLSLVLFVLLLASPRFQEYLVPVVSLYGALSIFYFVKTRAVFVCTCTLLLFSLATMGPHRGYATTVAQFKAIDQTYFQLVDKLSDSAFVFNCEWWGGHYVLHGKPKAQVIDVLDPTLLRANDERIFKTVTQLRSGQMADPYFYLKTLLQVDAILCSTQTPLHAQLLRDARFEVVAKKQNSAEILYLFIPKPPQAIAFVDRYKHWKNGTAEDWLRSPGTPSQSYLIGANAQTCMEFSPHPDELRKISSDAHLVLSGRGTLAVFKNEKLYLAETTLPANPYWGEVAVPTGSESNNWLFRICPDKLGLWSLGAFIISGEDFRNLCSTDSTRSEAQFVLPQTKCAVPVAVPRSKNE